MEWLKGKKTYVISAGTILLAIGGFLSGEADLPQTIIAICAALGLGTLRAGVQKSENASRDAEQVAARAASNTQKRNQNIG